MKRIFLFLLIAMHPYASYANDCACGFLEGPALSILTSDRLYVARLLSAEYRTSDERGGEGYGYRIEVIEALRGAVASNTVLTGFSPKKESCWNVPVVMPGDYFLTDGDLTSPCGLVEKDTVHGFIGDDYSFSETMALEFIQMSPGAEKLIHPDAYNRKYKKVLRCIDES
jgi:hypothetical protein